MAEAFEGFVNGGELARALFVVFNLAREAEECGGILVEDALGLCHGFGEAPGVGFDEAINEHELRVGVGRNALDLVLTGDLDFEELAIERHIGDFAALGGDARGLADSAGDLIANAMLGAERDGDAAVAESAFDEGFVGGIAAAGRGAARAKRRSSMRVVLPDFAAADDAVEVGGEVEFPRSRGQSDYAAIFSIFLLMNFNSNSIGLM